MIKMHMLPVAILIGAAQGKLNQNWTLEGELNPERDHFELKEAKLGSLAPRNFDHITVSKEKHIKHQPELVPQDHLFGSATATEHLLKSVHHNAADAAAQ